jgi:hypothetical protein
MISQRISWPKKVSFLRGLVGFVEAHERVYGWAVGVTGLRLEMAIGTRDPIPDGYLLH